MTLRHLYVAVGFALVILVGVYVIGQSAPSTFVTYDCEFVSPEEMAQVLRVLFPKTSKTQIVVDRDNQRVLVNGSEEIQAIARRAFEEIDRPEEPTQPRNRHAKSQIARQIRSQPDGDQYFEETSDENDLQSASQREEPSSRRNVSRNSARGSQGDEFDPNWPDGNWSSPEVADVKSSLRKLTPSSPAPRPEENVLQIVSISPDRFARVQHQLKSCFDHRMMIQRIDGREIARIDSSQQPIVRWELEFDRLRGGVLISGASNTIPQLAVLIQTFAANELEPARQTRGFSLRRQNHSDIERIIQPVSENQSSLSARDSRNQEPNFTPRRNVTPVGFFQEDAPPSDAGPADTEQDDQSPTRLPTSQFEGVEVKSLPDLDVIILRGRDKDLSQLADIIEQLEKISEENQPEARVIPLQHASSEAVADIISQTNKDLLSGRTGKVSVTPLVKPNALLVVGWGAAVEAVEKMIQELDQPVSPQSQSATYRLKYAVASDVQKALTSFFANRKGLGPKVQSTIDSRTNSLLVYAAPRDMLEVSQLIEELDQPGSDSVHQAKVFQLQHSLASDVAATLQQAIRASTGTTEPSSILELQTFDAKGQRILRSGSLENVRITPNLRSNSLLVACSPQNLDLIAELIRQLDTPAVEAQIKVFEIVNGDAASLIQTLRSLLPSQAGAASGVQLPSSTDESSLAPLRFSVDVRSNSIIATGSEGDLRIVEALLTKLDQSTSIQRKSAVYHLKNSPALDVAKAVNEFLVNRNRVERAAPGQDSPFHELEREVVVVPEPVGNKLILAATERYFDEINQLIERLDQQPPQVMIQIMIAQVTLNNTDEFGIELGLQNSVLFDRSLLGNIFTTTSTTSTSTAAGIVTATQQLIQAASNTPGFAFNSANPLGNSGSTTATQNANAVGGQGISNFGVGTSNSQLGYGGLVLSASSENVSALLRALQESHRLDVLSRPQIRTLDNQSAFIQVGQRVPQIKGVQLNQIGQSNSIDLIPVGLILGVTPRISPLGNVVMEIDAEKSAVGTDADGIPVSVSSTGTIIRSPKIDITTAQATVSAADGETVILGGLITEQTAQFHRQVPWLGDVPILGHLFRFDGSQRQRSELLIILTPHVIRSQEDEERLRQVEMAQMSWCAADVVRIHGNIGLPATTQVNWLDSGDPDVIYPDQNPAGDPQPLPQPAPPAELDPIQLQSGVVPADLEQELPAEVSKPPSVDEKPAVKEKSSKSKPKRKTVSRRRPFLSNSP